jgi:D(-)-tartrate dehydratase
VRIVDVRETVVPIKSQIRNAFIDFSQMTVSVLALITDVVRDGKPVVGFGFNSNGRYAPSGLLRDRFIPRLKAADSRALLNDAGDNLDPARVWDAVMRNEKPGGHGERSVAVGVLDMAVWDAVAKIAGVPLHRFLADRYRGGEFDKKVFVYAAGGYYYPGKDLTALQNEMAGYLELGYSVVKMKIGGAPLSDEAGDPLDYDLQAKLAPHYPGPMATGENLFSVQDARNLIRYAGLRPNRDVLQFDCALSYGLVEYLRILDMLKEHGWSPRRCIPHGGHQMSLNIAAGLGLGGNESYPGIFQPFGGFADGIPVEDSYVRLPEIPGIGFEAKNELFRVMKALMEA